MKNLDKNKILHLTINGVKYDWHQQYISGTEIKRLGNISNDAEIYLTIKKPWEDELIQNDTKVDLARPEIEHFFSKERPFEIVLMINGRPKPWAERTISFDQLVILAFGQYNPDPRFIYTITFDNGPKENPDGSMVRGNQVFTKNKMIFNVSEANQS